MCGIVGAYHTDGLLPPSELLERSVERLRRRGPDDSGTWCDTNVQLGHRRLAIVDLSQAGHQPMVSADGRFVITYNGEIYNHAALRRELSPPGGWRGTSDTETLLEAYRRWGTGCLTRLEGMFAFGIWDRVERRLLLARDRVGLKPLYYGRKNGLLAFGSRPTAVLPLLGPTAGAFDTQALALYLELGYIPAPLSLHEALRKLQPAHFLTADERGIQIVRWWDYRHISPDPALLARPEADLVDELDELVGDAVRIRLMSDVPFGAFLSGGVDSALTVAAMKRAGVSIPNAFTIAFHESDYDEGPAAARIAREIGVDHVTETLRVQDLLDLLPLFVEEFDEPFADSSAFPTLAVARLARRHVTVALSGDGADELFGGYHYYGLMERLARLGRLPARAQDLLKSIAGALPVHRAKLFAGVPNVSSPAGIFSYLRGCAKDFGSLLAEPVPQCEQAADWFERTAAGFAMDLTPPEIGMRLDLSFMLVDGYLQKVDVATMAFSLEARCPMLDYRLIEWAMRLPIGWKIRGNQTKYLLKKALCRHLPADLVHRPKRGFGVPITHWLRGPLREWARDLVHDPDLLSRVPLDAPRLRRLLDLHQSGERDAHPVLWAVLMLLCFVAHHDRGLQVSAPAVRRAA